MTDKGSILHNLERLLGAPSSVPVRTGPLMPGSPSIPADELAGPQEHPLRNIGIRGVEKGMFEGHICGPEALYLARNGALRPRPQKEEECSAACSSSTPQSDEL